MAKFEKMRVSLARGEDAPLAAAVGGDDPRRGRAQHLQAAFGESRTFLHLKNATKFTFDPIACPTGFVGGVFKREKPEVLRHENLEPYKAENYESAVVVVSTEKDQVAWVEINQKVGSSKSLLESFFDYLLKKSDVNDWRAYVEYMDNPAEYWSVIRERQGEIAKIVFTFVPPNALSASDRVYQFVKDVSLEAHPDVQQHTYRSQPGAMKPDTPLLTASAEIAMAGGGDAEVRDEKHRILYSSSRSRIIDEVADDDLPTPTQPSFMRRVVDRLYRPRKL
jgi:hypothetical protein